MESLTGIIFSVLESSEQGLRAITYLILKEIYIFDLANRATLKHLWRNVLEAVPREQHHSKAELYFS